MSENTFYVFKDQYLLFNRWKPQDAVFADEEGGIDKMRKVLGNESDKIFIVDRGDSQLRSEIISEHFKGAEDDIKRLCK